jgi:hypothetical protein
MTLTADVAEHDQQDDLNRALTSHHPSPILFGSSLPRLGASVGRVAESTRSAFLLAKQRDRVGRLALQRKLATAVQAVVDAPGARWSGCP